jgi:hypothetical protein
VKRTERGNSIGVVIHICMGTTQGNSLCSYLYLRLAKCHVSHFIFYGFSSTKLENRREEQYCGEWGEPRGEGGDG